MSNASVFMIGWEYPPHNSGGLGVACEGLTKALAGQNTHIYFTLPYHHAQAIGHMDVLECVDPAWDLPTGIAPFNAYAAAAVLPQQPSRFDADALHALPTSEMEWRVGQYRNVVLEQAQQHQDFDVVHAHDWMTFPAAVTTQQELGKPLVAHVHSTEFDRIPTGSGSQFIHQTEYEGLQRADQIIVVSYYTKRLLVDKYQVDPAKIQVVHNGAPALESISQPGSHHFAPHRPVIVFMGRLTMQKGAEYFLKTAQQVLHRQPNALFIVAGDGDMYRQLLVTTASQGLSAHVLFSGFLRGTERNKLLDRADVFVMPSLSEPFGLVAIEAAQRKTPVIVSKTAGVSEVMPSAISLDFWDTDKMSQTILSLLQNRPGRQVMVNKQLQEVARTTWEKAALDVRQVYRKAFLG